MGEWTACFFGVRTFDTGKALAWRAVERRPSRVRFVNLKYAEIAENGDGTWSCWFTSSPGGWGAVGPDLAHLPDALSTPFAVLWLLTESAW